ncbi:MAG: MSHA biogenesis protein MshK [Paraglaciecola sp.]|jgi:MSHA biogenesis protein MshK
MKIPLSIAMLVVICGQLWGQQRVDPTRPVQPQISAPDTEARASSIIELKAVFSKGVSKYAIINGETVTEGQQIAGFTVVLIAANRVVLLGSEGRQEFFVNNTHFKKDVNNGF